MIHELRIYHCVPGKLPALNNRFETITLKLWEKHQIRPIGFWTTLVGPNSNDLYYLIEWENMSERETKMNKFMTDPEWIAAKAQTEINGPIVDRVENMFLAPTAYSKIR
jgi:hypothetical protein